MPLSVFFISKPCTLPRNSIWICLNSVYSLGTNHCGRRNSPLAWLDFHTTFFFFLCSCIQIAAKVNLFQVPHFQNTRCEIGCACFSPFQCKIRSSSLLLSAMKKTSSKLWWRDETREIVYYSEWSFWSSQSFELIYCSLSSVIQNLIGPKFQLWWTFPKQKQQAASHRHILGLYPVYPYAADVNIIYWHKQLSAHGIFLSRL